MKKYLLFATLGMILSTPGYAVCVVVYSCGAGATGNVSGQRITTSTDSFIAANGNGCAKEGFSFVGWDFTGSTAPTVIPYGAFIRAGETYYSTGLEVCGSTNATLTLTAHWVPNSDLKTVASKAYVDTQLGTKMNILSGLSGDVSRVLTLPDAEVPTESGWGRARSITDTLGRPGVSGNYTNPSGSMSYIPTRGAVLGGVDTRQDTLAGTSGYALTFDTNGGAALEKPIYDVSNDAKTAQSLVSVGTVNTAVINAVNSELTQITESGTPSSSGSLWLLNDDITGLVYFRSDTLPSDETEPLSSFGTNLNGGAFGNNDGIQIGRGEWALVYDGTRGASRQYVIGESMCSNYNYKEEDLIVEDNDALSDIETQYSAGDLNEGNTCFCRLKSPGRSQWFYANSSGGCGDDCANWCVDVLLKNGISRSLVFRTVGQ